MNNELKNGDTVLMMLADKGDTEGVILHFQQLGPEVGIVELTEYVNRTNDYGNTALMLAANHAHYTIVDILLKAGAKHDIVNSAMQTAADMANTQDLTDIIDLLVLKGAVRPEAIVRPVSVDKIVITEEIPL